MPTYRYARASVENLTAYLAANLNGYISTISTEEGWASPLATPDVYRASKTPQPSETIAVEVDTDGFDPDDLHNNVWYVDCFVRFWMRIQDADIVTAQQQLRAYNSALVRCLMASPEIPASGSGAPDYDGQIGRTDFSALTQGEGGQLYTEFITHLTVKREET